MSGRETTRMTTKVLATERVTSRLARLARPAPMPGARAPGIPGWVRQWRPPRPLGGCGVGPTLLSGADDNSGSVASYSDPVRYRHALFFQAARALARACRCGKCSVAVVTFDRAACFGPVPLSRKSLRDLEAFLASVPPTSSHLAGALGRLEEVARAHDGPVVSAVCSDFELFDPDLPRLYRRFGQLPGHPLAVVLRASPPQILSDLVPVVAVDTTAPRTAVADALAEALAVVRG